MNKPSTTDEKLTQFLIRKEIAQRSARSAWVALFLVVLSLYFAFGVTPYNWAIYVCALISIALIAIRVFYVKKFLSSPNKNSYWWIIKSTHWINAVLMSLILSLTLVNTEITSPHHILLFVLLASYITSCIFTVALDNTIFLPVLFVVFLPLIGIASYSPYSLFAYVVYLCYLLLQYRFLKRQLLDSINFQLQLEKTNQELKKNDLQQDYFMQLALKLLSNKDPLDVIFKTLILFFEELIPNTVCSILFLDKNKKRFDTVYAPNFPDFYNKAITQLDIGENAGSCGRAAYIGERVIVEDIQTNPLWDPYRELAREADLAACWSQPIKNNKNETLGTFAIYHRTPHFPSERDIQTIEQAAELVKIILQHFETEEMIKKVQNQTSLIYNSSIDAMWLIDIEDEGQTYRFKSINDAFTTVTGLTREQVLEKTVEQVLPPSSIEIVRSKYHEAATTKNIVDYIEIAPLPSGIKVGQIRVKPIKDERGIVTKILGIAEDITDKKRVDDLLIEREADLVYAQHVAQLGSWKWEAKTDTVSWTKEIYTILDLDPNQPPMPFTEQAKLYTPESWEKLKSAVKNTMTTGQSYEVDLEGRTAKNNPRWFVARGGVTEKDTHGNPIRLAGTLQNITERKLLENNLMDALKSRDEFIAVATHELKTPLTTLQILLYTILKTLDSDFDKEKLISRLEKVKMQTERLEALIKNLLDVTSIGAGKINLDLKPGVNFSELLETVTKKYEDEILKTGSVVIKTIEPQIIGLWDEFRLEQVITNLLTNVIKYGNGKPIKISLKRVAQNALLEVTDQGIGIATDMQQKVFERFERAVSETNYQGLGLGLWIVREIVNALNGKVWVNSTLGVGSQFSVELPIKAQKSI